mgnify:FL=1|tara:strand:- start:1078 stop:1374 length:297 start_codon:yes stop_codon:yes gene_type:complete
MVMNPSNSTHTLSIVTRFYPDNELTVYLYNEATEVTTTPVNTYSVSNGKLKIDFTFTFLEKDRFQVKIEEENEVIYRGILFATSQEPQDYSESEGVYF